MQVGCNIAVGIWISRDLVPEWIFKRKGRKVHAESAEGSLTALRKYNSFLCALCVKLRVLCG